MDEGERIEVDGETAWLTDGIGYRLAELDEFEIQCLLADCEQALAILRGETDDDDTGE